MYGEIRNFFNDTETQTHICKIVEKTLTSIFQVIKANKGFHEQDYLKIDEKINELKRADITALSKVFLERFDYKNENDIWSKGNVVTMLRSATDRNAPIQLKPNITEAKIKSFYSKIVELAPLVRLIREHRNHFSHLNGQVRNEVGWNTSVLASIIRVCELSVVPKESHELNNQVIDDSQKLLGQLLAESIGAFPSQKQDIKKNDKGNDQKLLSSINDINSKLDLMRGDIKSYHDDFEERLTNTLSTEKVSNTEEEEEEELEEVEEIGARAEDDNFKEKITPEVLRTELRILSGKINTHFEKDKSFSPSLNLVTLSSISEILDNEPESLDKFLQLENIKFVIDQHPEIYNKQIKKFGKKVDALLENVLWPMEI